MVWYRRRRRRRSSVTKHYLTHKELARSVILQRLLHYNQLYGYEWNRVAIRNQRTCWGSCTELGNLNFSYRLLFLPEELRDYIVVHELCHLKELNHSPAFWTLVAVALPNYRELKTELRRMEQMPQKLLTLVEKPLSQPVYN